MPNLRCIDKGKSVPRDGDQLVPITPEQLVVFLPEEAINPQFLIAQLVRIEGVAYRVKSLLYHEVHHDQIAMTLQRAGKDESSSDDTVS